MAISNQVWIILIGLLVSWGYLIIFITSILEATPVFGFLSPGQVFVAIGGFLAKLGMLNFWGVLIAAFIGGLIGDTLSYWLGKHYGHEFISKLIRKYGKYLFIKESHFQKTNELMEEHHGKVLIIGRFNSVTRAFGPFVAGTSNTKFGSFMFYNVVGSLTWAAVFTILGYLFGESYQIISGYMSNAVLIIIVVVALALYARHHFKKLKKKQDIKILEDSEGGDGKD